VLLARQHAILARYLTKLSPLADVHVDDVGRICATDLARARDLFPATTFRYAATATARGAHEGLVVDADADAAGRVCVVPHPTADPAWRDDDPRRLTVIEVTDGTTAHPLAVHAYDLDRRGFRIVGIERR
jgi:hypothetical protein